MSRLPPPFGPFYPLRRLGAGGMAETFVAVRRGPGDFEQHVCIKRILPAFEDDRDFVDGFLHEAKTSAALRHGNIVQVLDFGVADGAHYLALELIDGLDLRALLSSPDNARARLDAELTTLIAGDLCAALEHAHGEASGRPQVVHRDVSPSNVLISHSGEVKLTDFGIARAIGGSHRTASGVIKGKVPYMPPEYIERGQFDERGDLFSLGVMLYELLAGQRPFDGESDLDTIRRIVVGTHVPLRELAPEAPKALVECVERLIETVPERRFSSARELLDALPHVANHRVRRRLGDMVRERKGEPVRADALAGTVAASPSAPPPAAASQPPRAISQAPTRTSRRADSAGLPRPSHRALLALLGAGLCLVGVLSAAYLRLWNRGASTPTNVPALPSLPRPQPPTPKGAEPTVADPSKGEPTRQPVAPTPRQAAELKVYVHPFGDIWIDGKRVGQSPVTISLPPGNHEVGVGDGRPKERRTVRLSAGEHERLEIQRSDVADPQQ